MSSTKDYILEQLRDVANISYRPMMGEFLLYKDGILLGGIYDDRLLIKITKNNKKYNMEESIPYHSAKHMYLVNEIYKLVIVDRTNVIDELISAFKQKGFEVSEIDIYVAPKEEYISNN